MLCILLCRCPHLLMVPARTEFRWSVLVSDLRPISWSILAIWRNTRKWPMSHYLPDDWCLFCLHLAPSLSCSDHLAINSCPSWSPLCRRNSGNESTMLPKSLVHRWVVRVLAVHVADNQNLYHHGKWSSECWGSSKDRWLLGTRQTCFMGCLWFYAFQSQSQISWASP